MSRSPLTETIKRVEGMVLYVQQNLSGDEYNLFLDMVDPQPDPAPAKKTRKKRTKKSTKAQSLSSVIAKTPKADAETGSVSLDAEDPICGICGHTADHTDHDRNYLKSHDFEPPKSVATATRRSSRKAAAANSTPNSETNSEGALAVGAGGD